jgi:hypothetical protein
MKKLHPIVYDEINKIYKWYYKNNEKKINDLFHYLEIKVQTSVTLQNLEEILYTLTFDEILKLAEDIILNSIFWPSEKDEILRRNYETKKYNLFQKRYHLLGNLVYEDEPLEPVIEEQKLWGKNFMEILSIYCGIFYNKDTKIFSIRGKHDLQVTSKILTNEKLIRNEINNYFLKELINEINGTYMTGFYTSTLILIRKLFENFVILLLEHKFPKDKHLDLYFDKTKGRYKFFNELIEILNANRNEFIETKKTLERFISKILPLKEESNLTNHLYTYIAHRSDIEKLDIPDSLELFKIISEKEGLNNIFND